MLSFDLNVDFKPSYWVLENAEEGNSNRTVQSLQHCYGDDDVSKKKNTKTRPKSNQLNNVANIIYELNRVYSVSRIGMPAPPLAELVSSHPSNPYGRRPSPLSPRITKGSPDNDIHLRTLANVPTNNEKRVRVQ